MLTRNLRWAKEQGGLVVRLLVLPGHVDCCLAPAADWLAAELSEAPVHVMTGYLPPATRLIPGLAQPLSAEEVERAWELVRATGLKEVA